MSKEIEIKGGKVVISDFVTRRAWRLQNEGISYGLNNDAFGKDGKKDIKIPLSNLERGNDGLVLGMIQSAEINGKKVEVNIDFIDSLSQDDFKKISGPCNKIKDKKEEKKTESQTKPETT